MVKIESFDGKEKIDAGCLGCAMESGKVDFSRGTIIKTKYFDVHQDYETPIAGFFVVSTRRHIISIADFSAEEQKEFVHLICKIREGMNKKLGIKDVYLFQKETSTHHFHFCFFPCISWMDKIGQGLSSMLAIMNYARYNMKTEKNLKEIREAIAKMQKWMKGFK